MGTNEGEWVTTGDAATLLGVSRQHVVDLCDRGELHCHRVGTHRRLRRAEIQERLRPQLTREQEKSLWLHRALLGRLMMDPDAVLGQARQNVDAWLPLHRPGGAAERYLQQWNEHLAKGVDDVVPVLTGMDEHSCELRQNSPFAGVLSEEERAQVLHAFRQHWATTRRAA